MAKKATGKSNDKPSANLPARKSSGTGGSSGKDNGFKPGEAFIKLLQSPFVSELVAVAATAALAALAEHGFTSGGDGTRGKRASKAVKEAGKAAAAAVSRRLSTEIDEIRKAASTAGAKA